MKKNEWNEGLNNLAPDLIEKYVEQEDRLRHKNKSSQNLWIRFGAIAACFMLVISAITVILMQRPKKPIYNDPEEPTANDPEAPIINVKTPSSAPHYYGDVRSSEISGGEKAEADLTGISVTAKFIEALPDIYTFFDDWDQNEFRLLRMQTIKLLRGQEMTEEFYYLVPIAFFTDFSVFDRFVIKDMAQLTYDYAVMYNKTQDKAELLNLVVFGYRMFDHNHMGENLAAFDADGNFDDRLWKANDAWINATGYYNVAQPIMQTEKNIKDSEWKQDLYVHLLKDISGEAGNILAQIRKFDNEVYVPLFSTEILSYSSEVQFQATRYINGFATNEKVSVWSKEITGADQDTYDLTNARFGKDDLNNLPDLSSAFESVKESLKSGVITPPHFNNHEELKNTKNGVFGWYAKTENGIIGVVRVTWRFYTVKNHYYYDDAYYIVEYGSDKCKSIDRDDLLSLFGDCETLYIYLGKYNNDGKIIEKIVEAE